MNIVVHLSLSVLDSSGYTPSSGILLGHMAVLFPGCFVCVCVCEPKNDFFKKNFKRKAPDYCFLLGMERGVDQKAHCVLFKVLSHWTLRLQVWKKKKKSLKHVRLTILCLTLSGNLEELQFWPVGGSSMGNHREEKRLWVCSLHSQEPEWITKNWPWKPGRWAVDTEPTNNLIPCHASRETQK